MSYASELSHRLADQAETVCKAYLPHGRRSGRYWIAGDVHDERGRSLFVKLHGEGAGRWTEYVAPRVMLRICDWVLSHRRLTASTRHHASALREVV
jgi:hypothetical protein